MTSIFLIVPNEDRQVKVLCYNETLSKMIKTYMNIFKYYLFYYREPNLVALFWRLWCFSLHSAHTGTINLKRHYPVILKKKSLTSVEEHKYITFCVNLYECFHITFFKFKGECLLTICLINSQALESEGLISNTRGVIFDSGPGKYTKYLFLF